MDGLFVSAARSLIAVVGLSLSVAPLAAGGPYDCDYVGPAAGCGRPYGECRCRERCREEKIEEHCCCWPWCRKRRPEIEIEGKFYAREAPRAFVLTSVPAVLLAQTAVPVGQPEADFELAVRERRRELLLLDIQQRLKTEEDSAADQDGAPKKKRQPQPEADTEEQCVPAPCAATGVPGQPSAQSLSAVPAGAGAASAVDAAELARLRREVAELRAMADELRRVRTAAAEQVN